MEEKIINNKVSKINKKQEEEKDEHILTSKIVFWMKVDF